MHDSFPHALELSKKGYNAFALIYRPGAETACEDLARAIAANPSADHSSETSELRLSSFDHLGHNMLLSAFGWPLGFHMLGGALTYKFSKENNDLMVARFAACQNQLVYGIAFTPGMMMGTFFPILVPGYMYFFQRQPRAEQHRRRRRAGYRRGVPLQQHPQGDFGARAP